MKLPKFVSRKNIPVPTVLAALVVIGLCSVTGGGFMAVPVLIVLIFIYALGLSGATDKGAAQHALARRAAVWLIAFAVIFATHYVRSQLLRSNAEDMLARIDAYAASHRHCAPGIEDLGISRKEMTSRLGYSLYLCKDGQQVFFYAASFTIFSTWNYDFQKREWRLRYS